MATTTTEVLKMEFTLAGSSKTASISLKDPKTGLLKNQVDTFAAEVIGKNGLKVDGKFPAALKSAVIVTTTTADVPTA